MYWNWTRSGKIWFEAGSEYDRKNTRNSDPRPGRPVGGPGVGQSTTEEMLGTLTQRNRTILRERERTSPYVEKDRGKTKRIFVMQFVTVGSFGVAGPDTYMAHRHGTERPVPVEHRREPESATSHVRWRFCTSIPRNLMIKYVCEFDSARRRPF